MGMGLLRTNVLSGAGVLGGWFLGAHKWLGCMCPVTTTLEPFRKRADHLISVHPLLLQHGQDHAGGGVRVRTCMMVIQLDTQMTSDRPEIT